VILSDKTILKKLKDQELIIEPFSTSQLQSASVDLRLANHFLTIEEKLISSYIHYLTVRRVMHEEF
jgi:dCTP deaminase